VSVTIDANVLVYASNEADALHEPARSLLEELAGGPGIVYLFWPVIMGYLRIVTHPGILPRPLAPRNASANVAQLLERPHVRTPGEADGFWESYRVAAGGDTRGNAVPDARLVALMRQHGVGVIYTRDRDFRRYEEIEARDPFG
jgi:uncharacterized protein